MTESLFEPISKLDLKELQRLALKGHETFFKRDPRLKIGKLLNRCEEVDGWTH